MRESILINLIAIATCLCAAILLFKLIFKAIPNGFKYAKLTKSVLSVIYWMLFILALNIPIESREYYNVVPFENGEYVQLHYSEHFDDYFVFNYEEAGVIHSRYFYLKPGYQTGWDSLYNDENVENITGVSFGHTEPVSMFYKFEESEVGNSTAITVFKSASLLQGLFNLTSEYWKINTPITEVQRIYVMVNDYMYAE